MQRAAALYKLIFAVIFVASLHRAHFVRCFVGLFLFVFLNELILFGFWDLGLGIVELAEGELIFFSFLDNEGC